MNNPTGCPICRSVARPDVATHVARQHRGDAYRDDVATERRAVRLANRARDNRTDRHSFEF